MIGCVSSVFILE